MCSLCPLPVAKNHNFGQILNFGGLLYRLPFTDKAQIWCPEADRASTLMCQISSENVHCVGFQWPKTTILGKFWHLGGFCTDRLLPMRAVQCGEQLAHSKTARTINITSRSRDIHLFSINNHSFDTDQYSAPALWWHVKKTPPPTELQIPAMSVKALCFWAVCPDRSCYHNVSWTAWAVSIRPIYREYLPAPTDELVKGQLKVVAGCRG